jgi:hypothetical protein
VGSPSCVRPIRSILGPRGMVSVITVTEECDHGLRVGGTQMVQVGTSLTLKLARLCRASA